MEHELKCWPEFFEALHNGTKLLELRTDDRPFQVGDILRQREWEPGGRYIDGNPEVGGATVQGYSGREIRHRVTYLLRHPTLLPSNVVAMSLSPMTPEREKKSGVCIHGALRRQCETCDLADRLDAAEAKCKALEADLSQWRGQAEAVIDPIIAAAAQETGEVEGWRPETARQAFADLLEEAERRSMGFESKWTKAEAYFAFRDHAKALLNAWPLPAPPASKEKP